MNDRARRIAVLVLIAAIDVLFVASSIAMDPGVHVAGMGLLLVAVWTAVVARGVWKQRTWANVASLVTFGPMAVVALLLSVDVVRRMQDIASQAPPRVHLIAPAVVTICAGAITALVSGAVRRPS